MITFILQDIIVSIVVSFTIGLYVGAFVQCKRDIKALKPTQKVIENFMKKYAKKEEIQNETKVC